MDFFGVSCSDTYGAGGIYFWRIINKINGFDASLPIDMDITK
jgi:hypothetical protein